MTQVPARSTPKLVVEILKDYVHSPMRAQGFTTYWFSRGKLFAKETAEQYQFVPEVEQDPTFYRDWGILEDFTLADRGSGECGVGVVELVATELQKAEKLWQRAAKARDRSDDQTQYLLKTVVTSAGALLLVTGQEPDNPEQVLDKFRKAFLETGIGDSEYGDLLILVEEMLRGELVDLSSSMEEIRQFLDHTQNLFDRMDASLNFR